MVATIDNRVEFINSSRTFYWKSVDLGNRKFIWNSDGLPQQGKTLAAVAKAAGNYTVDAAAQLNPYSDLRTRKTDSNVTISMDAEPYNSVYNTWEHMGWTTTFVFDKQPNSNVAWLNIDISYVGRYLVNTFGPIDTIKAWDFEFQKTVSMVPISNTIVEFLQPRDIHALGFVINVKQLVKFILPQKPFIHLRIRGFFATDAYDPATLGSTGNPRLEVYIAATIVSTWAAIRNLRPIGYGATSVTEVSDEDSEHTE